MRWRRRRQTPAPLPEQPEVPQWMWDLAVQGFDEDGVPIGERGKDMRPVLRAHTDKES